MLNIWIERLTGSLNARPEADSLADLERVSAMLLVEIARADHQVDHEERDSIRQALRQTSVLDDEELDSILESVLTDVEHSLSLHEHIQQINDGFDKPQKLKLVEQMWRVAFADGNLDKYEEYTIRKLSDLLYIKHRDFMQAKLRVLDSLDRDS